MAVKNRQPARSYTNYALASQPSAELLNAESVLYFDYTQVADEHRTAVIAHTKTIKRHERRTVESMVTIGHELIAVQAKLPHGQFLSWIEQEFGWQKTVAYNLIQLGNKFPTVGNLPPGIGLSALYQLTGPNMPDAALAEATARQAAGEKITKTVATEIATRHRSAEIAPRGFPPLGASRHPPGSKATTNPSYTVAPPTSPASTPGSPVGAQSPHPLTVNEAIAVIWRAIQHQAPSAPAERLAWLTAAQFHLFKDFLQPGVILTAEIFTKAYATVTTDLAGTIEREARTKVRTTYGPTATPHTPHSHREIVVALRLLKMVKAPLAQAAIPVNQYTPHGATISIWLQLLDEIIADLQKQADDSLSPTNDFLSPQPEDIY